MGVVGVVAAAGGAATEEAEGGLVVREGLGGSAHPAGAVAGPHRGGEGEVAVAGGERVAGEIGLAPERGVLEEGVGAGPVQLEPLVRQEVVEDGLGEQGVAELVAAVAPRLEDVVLDGRAEGVAQDRRLDPGDPFEEDVGHPPPDDRRHPDHALRGLGELVDPGEEQPLEVLGVPGAGADGGGELLGEEGVALGPADEVVDDARGQRLAAAPDDPSDGGVRERAEVDPGEPGQARPDGQGRRQRVPAVDVVAAVGGEQPDALGSAAGEQEGEELAGGLVGPVDVLDDEQDRAPASEVGEGAVDGLDEVGPDGVAPGTGGEPGHEGHQARVGLDEVVHERPVAGVEPGEHLDEGQVRQARADLADAVADEDPAVAGAGDEPADEGGLPDAGVAADEDRAAVPVGAECGRDALDLLVTTDELGDGTGRHGPDHGTRHRRDGGHGCRGRRVAVGVDVLDVVGRGSRERTNRATTAAKGWTPRPTGAGRGRARRGGRRRARGGARPRR